MTTYKVLLAQRAKLDLQIAERRESEVKTALETIRGLIADHGLTSKDVFAPQSRSNKSNAPAKYQDPATGAQWSGRGKAPKWMAGKDRDKFKIAQ